jgi:predicted ATPase
MGNGRSPSYINQGLGAYQLLILTFIIFHMTQAPIFRTFREGKLRYFLLADLFLSLCGITAMVVIAVLEILVFPSVMGARRGPGRR